MKPLGSGRVEGHWEGWGALGGLRSIGRVEGHWKGWGALWGLSSTCSKWPSYVSLVVPFCASISFSVCCMYVMCPGDFSHYRCWAWIVTRVFLSCDFYLWLEGRIVCRCSLPELWKAGAGEKKIRIFDFEGRFPQLHQHHMRLARPALS